jgi:hypothetical protein
LGILLRIDPQSGLSAPGHADDHADLLLRFATHAGSITVSGTPGRLRHVDPSWWGTEGAPNSTTRINFFGMKGALILPGHGSRSAQEQQLAGSEGLPNCAPLPWGAIIWRRQAMSLPMGETLLDDALLRWLRVQRALTRRGAHAEKVCGKIFDKVLSSRHTVLGSC